jgi:hypothetical protein
MMPLTRRDGWPQESVRFGGHTVAVPSVAITADGKTLVSGRGIRTKPGETKLGDVAAISKLGGGK